MNQEPRKPELILASSSPIRKSLMARLGLPFEVRAAHVDESPVAGEQPGALASRLARWKAERLALDYPDALVIGADQVAAFDGKLTGKPGTVERARSTLAAFSGRRVDFHTGLAVVRSRDRLLSEHLDRTQVRFRTLDAGEIARYVERDGPLDCAGSFRLEALGPALFDAVHSEDPTALLGLPLIALCRLLREAGWRIP